MVGAGNFGLLACSRDDFMQIQTSVMDALSRAEAQFGDDEEFADAIMEEIDRLFDEFEMPPNVCNEQPEDDEYLLDDVALQSCSPHNAIDSDIWHIRPSGLFLDDPGAV